MAQQALMPVFEMDDGWWIDASRVTPDQPHWGPYTTKREALEQRASYLRSQKFRKTPLMAEESECR